MNIEKLKPWNWFKHENESTSHIPVSKDKAVADSAADSKAVIAPQNQAVSSLMQLHQQMDRLFDGVWRSFGVSSQAHSSNLGFTRPISLMGNNLFENSLLGDYSTKLDISGGEDNYEISIDLPGFAEDDISIEVRANTLIVKGEKEEKNESKDKQYYRMERSIGSFQRTLSLPEDASRDDISARMKNGLLVINIPRKALAQDDVKRISISS